MSERTIARWNAIPLERPDESAPTSLKRGRPEDEQDEDDISLVSRSPSPLPQDAMDVDGENLHKYDEYIRGPAREVITVETKIKPSNIGFALLTKLGWVEGQPVGLSGDGRTEPIPFHVKSDLTGLGKTSQDVRMIETTVSQRRGLDSERQQKESEEQRKLREDSVARKTALESEITSTLRAFYCALCDKQFKNVAQYDEHTNSYSHHHKARFKDMQASIRLKPKDEVDKRKEKERKREEKELRKIAAANGIKMAKPTTSSSSVSLIPPSGTLNAPTTMEVDTRPVEPKKGGWASITSEQSPSSGSHDSFRKSGGWATPGSSPSNVPLPQRYEQPPPPSSSYSQTAGDMPNHVPTFRNAGWTSLDTGSSQPPPPPPPSAPPPPPPSFGHVQSHVPPPPSSIGSSHTAQGGWSRGITSTNPNASQPPPPPHSSRSSASTQSSFGGVGMPLPPPNPTPPPPPSFPPSNPPSASPETKAVRSWQQFQKGVGRKK